MGRAEAQIICRLPQIDAIDATDHKPPIGNRPSEHGDIRNDLLAFAGSRSRKRTGGQTIGSFEKGCPGAQQAEVGWEQHAIKTGVLCSRADRSTDRVSVVRTFGTTRGVN